jgi:heme/copper-type cytochrome/quinol oxidase subunit 3
MTTIDETAAVAPRKSTGRALLVTQTTLLVLFGLLEVLPYYANGLHDEPPSKVEGGWFDPKGLWPYDTPVIGEPLTVLLGISALGWVIATMCSLMALVQVFRRTERATRVRLLTAAVLGVAYLAVQFSPFGRHIAVWIAD